MLTPPASPAAGSKKNPAGRVPAGFLIYNCSLLNASYFGLIFPTFVTAAIAGRPRRTCSFSSAYIGTAATSSATVTTTALLLRHCAGCLGKVLRRHRVRVVINNRYRL